MRTRPYAHGRTWHFAQNRQITRETVTLRHAQGGPPHRHRAPPPAACARPPHRGRRIRRRPPAAAPLAAAAAFMRDGNIAGRFQGEGDARGHGTRAGTLVGLSPWRRATRVPLSPCAPARSSLRLPTRTRQGLRRRASVQPSTGLNVRGSDTAQLIWLHLQMHGVHAPRPRRPPQRKKLQIAGTVILGLTTQE